MSAVVAQATLSEAAGGWRIIAHRPGYEAVDVTTVRGATTQLGEFKAADPFGPSTASLIFPAVTMYDDIGDGELFWLAPEVNFDIEWVGELPPGYPDEKWVWEGFSMPFDYSEVGFTVTLVGALFQLDHYLAKPEFPLQPIAVRGGHPGVSGTARCTCGCARWTWTSPPGGTRSTSRWPASCRSSSRPA